MIWEYPNELLQAVCCCMMPLLIEKVNMSAFSELSIEILEPYNSEKALILTFSIKSGIKQQQTAWSSSLGYSHIINIDS